MGGEAQRLLGDHHRRADRVGAVGPDQHRADRPQARHQFGRALPLRARRRSQPSCCRGSSSRPAWCSISAAASRRRSRSPARRRRPSASSISRSRSCARLAGVEVGLPEIKRVLGHLGFFVAGQGPAVKIAVPSWRPDVHGKADIVEEVVRIIGVDRVPSTPFDRGEAPRKPVLTPIQVRTRKAKRALAARGMVEAVTWSFVSKPQAELFGGGKPELALANPIAADLSDMRPSLIPGLVSAAQKNADRGSHDVALFEVGQVFRGDQPQDQLTAAAGVRRGAGQGVGQRPALVGAGRRGRRLRRQGRCAGGARRRRRAGAGAAGGAGRPGLVPSGTLRHHPDRPAERARPFRRTASARARGARRRGPAGRLRGDPGQDPRAEGQGDARQAGARAVAVPAGRARLRLRGRPRGEGRRHRARRAVGRPQADRRRQRVRRLRRQGHRSRQEVDRDRRDACSRARRR